MAQVQLASVDVVDKLDKGVAAQEAEVDSQQTLEKVAGNTSLTTDHNHLY